MKQVPVYALLLVAFYSSCRAQTKTDLPKEEVKSEIKELVTATFPNTITRTIKQDRKGNIWIAAFAGIFRYDGASFTHVTSNVSSARFFSVLEDRKGNFWFSTIGSGVYYYDGKSFRNFTTQQGLIGNEVSNMYEDKAGHVWFGTKSGVSRFDGKSFRNYIMNPDSINEDNIKEPYLNFTTKAGNLDNLYNEVNSIVEDKGGKFWFGTKGNAYVYDGKTYTVLTHEGKPFRNVRTIIEDKKGNIWLSGNGGLWRYDGRTFTNFRENFVGSIYEDKKGNIWISSEGANEGGWALFRYDEKSLADKTPTVTEIKPEKGGEYGLLFGILEAKDGSIWFGALDGLYRYDGKTVTDFKR